MKRTIVFSYLFMLMGLAVSAQAQVTALPSTTLTQALGGGRTSDNGTAQKCFGVASLGSGSTTITAGIQGNQSGTVLLVDQELMQVYSVNTTTTQVCVNRGYQGTKQKGHLNGATVFYSQFSTGSTPGITGFGQSDPSGWCNTSLLAFQPIYSTQGSWLFNCFGSPGNWERGDVLAWYQFSGVASAATGSASPFTITDTAGNTGTTAILAVSTQSGSNAPVMSVTGGSETANGTPTAAPAALTVTGGAGSAGSGTNIAGGAGAVGLTATGGTGGAATGTATGGAGGANTIVAGVGGASVSTGTSGAGGAVTITGGASGGSASGGTVGTGGAVNITGGAASTTAGTAGVGGAANVTAGAGSPNTGSGGTGGAGGQGTIAGGAGGVASTGAATGGAGGAVNVTAGAGGGTITGGAGGQANVTAGAGANGSTAGGAGGNVVITAGNSGTGGTPAGGQIQLIPGTPTSTGNTGFVIIAGGAAGSHFASSQTTKPAAGGTCTTPAVANGSTDMRGQVSSASCTASQTMTATFNVPYATAPFCTCSPANAAGAVTASAAAVTFCSASTTVLTVTSPAASSTAGAWNYNCVQ